PNALPLSYSGVIDAGVNLFRKVTNRRSTVKEFAQILSCIACGIAQLFQITGSAAVEALLL
ncbi:MAG: hypothetical protein ABI164_05765, partial [Acidobacteriaceae bacterium]